MVHHFIFYFTLSFDKIKQKLEDGENVRLLILPKKNTKKLRFAGASAAASRRNFLFWGYSFVQFATAPFDGAATRTSCLEF
jgi:hypothetical protein